MSKRNKIITFCFIGIFFISTQVLALNVGLDKGAGSGLGQQDLRITIGQIINTVMGLLGIIFVIIVIASGAVYMFSQQDPEKKAKAKKIMTSAIIGLVIILTAYAITSFIVGIFQSESVGPHIVGDANGDGNYTANDLSRLNSYLSGSSVICQDLNGNEIDCAIALDINEDGAVDTVDHNLLRDEVLGR